LQPYHIERLGALAGLLEAVERRRISLFDKETGKTVSGLFNLMAWQSDEDQECGTTACACGYAGTHPWFQQRGFYLEQSGGGNRYPVYQRRSDAPRYEHWSAVEKFFGLTYREANYLFGYYAYSKRDAMSPKAVAKRIR